MEKSYIISSHNKINGMSTENTSLHFQIQRNILNHLIISKFRLVIIELYSHLKNAQCKIKKLLNFKILIMPNITMKWKRFFIIHFIKKNNISNTENNYKNKYKEKYSFDCCP